ncbi:MAG: hypothetical protein V4679_03520 [Pseudomonadota bacterium]
MNAPATRPHPSAWEHHLAAPGTVPARPLSSAEALRVQRHRDQLLAALRAQDRDALQCAKQAVLRAAYGPPGTPGAPASAALRAALRDLSWNMAILLLPRHPAGLLAH